MKLLSAFRYWSRGIRLYLAIGIALFTLESWWWAEVAHGGTLLFATRLEELYAWVAVTLLALAVSIGPVCSVWPRLVGKRLWFDARRLLGIGAAWFSLLHILISYDSLFKFANPLTLPGTYQRAFAAGTLASLILLAMAFTSFDKAFHGMGSWWFRLHRLVYLAVVLSLFHAFLVGAHATHLPALLSLTVVVSIVLGLHVYVAVKRWKTSSLWRGVSISVMAGLLIATLLFGYSQHAGHNILQGRPNKSTPQQMQSMPGMPAMHGMEMHN